MWTIVKKYYLLPFVGFLLLLSFKTFGIKSPNSWQMNLAVLTGMAVFLSVFVGTLYYFQDTRWGPRKRNKLMVKSPFKDFLDLGFERKEEYIVGKIRDYTLMIHYAWPSGYSAVAATVLFHPKGYGRFYEFHELKAIQKRNRKSGIFSSVQYEWTRFSIGLLLQYNFKPPSYQKVLDAVHRMIDILVAESLRPISYEENDSLLPELQMEIVHNKEPITIS